MLLFVKQYKQEALGVGEVALPGEAAALRDAAAQRTAKEAKDDAGNRKDAVSSTNGTAESTKDEYVSLKREVLVSLMCVGKTTDDLIKGRKHLLHTLARPWFAVAA